MIELDGRGSPIPPVLKELQGVDLLAAGQSWYANSSLPDVPSLTPTEISILWLIGSHDLTQASAAALLGLSIQRVSFLVARAIRKLHSAVPE